MDSKKEQITEAARLISPDELAELFGCSSWTIWRMRKIGQLPPAITIGRGMIRWRLSAILEWMAENERPADEIAPGLRSRAAKSVESRFGRRTRAADESPAVNGRRGRPSKREQVEGRR